jgi:enolase (EC 4.2.1.11)
MRIASLKAYEILDSRGNPTLRVKCFLEDGTVGIANVPSGASKGKNEALEIRDGGNRFFGKGVLKAVRNVEDEISKALVGKNALDQWLIDKTLINIDGTPNKSRLGANAILGVSLAVAHAPPTYLRIPLYRYIGGISARILPVPMLNFINGGWHADNNLDIQEFMIVPKGFERFRDRIRCAVEIFQTLKDILKEKGLSVSLGDEGGFAPNLSSNKEALDLLMMATERAGYKVGEEVFFALDCASSSFFDEERGIYRFEGKELNGKDLMDIYADYIKNYPIISIEDPFAEGDYDSWREFTSKFGDRITIVGDDLYTTNKKLIREGIEGGYSNAVLIKLNQIGTLSETLEAIEITKSAGWKAIISHRSGETEDTTIADLAVGTNAGWIKTGSVARSERTAKYNRLIEIEEEMGI